ncbi:MAG: tRNA-splicing endonuclease subunit [Bathelium mastoideum]|nr:MAG: tRNA-splicing endonuclease subunit [Bathelium mastoideum]
MTAPVPVPIPISQVAGRHFLYDADAITFLRHTYHITGALIGTLSQAPQQNVFLGVPLELMPEEVRLLVERNVAYVIDDAHHHIERHRKMSAADQTAILAAFHKQGSDAARAAQNRAGKRKEAALKRRGKTSSSEASSNPSLSTQSEQAAADEEEFLFASPANSFATRSLDPTTSPAAASATEPDPFGITPATSHPPLAPPTPPPESSRPLLPEVPSSYPVFRHLHDEGYFLSPGLRFGAQYMAYPGDPLRFHSHFLAVGRDWEEEWSLSELVGGGRLGTGVKKGFLIGGEVLEEAENKREDGISGNEGISTHTAERAPDVRTFCIEWGGM